MRVSKLVCGCSKEIARFDFDTDIKEYEGTTVFTGMCTICDENDKQRKGFNKSPYWREVPQKLSAKTLAFLAKGAQEAAQRGMEREFGPQKDFAKKKRA